MEKKHTRIAIMVDDEDAIESISKFNLDWLDPREDYQWSGWKVQKKVGKRSKRVKAGSYDQWFQWYMWSQRFHAFHNVVLIDPATVIANKEYGGYIDGLLARLIGKVRQVVVVARPSSGSTPMNDERRTKEVLRVLLYGTRLSKPDLFAQARRTYLPIPEEMAEKGLKGLELHLTPWQTRYQLDSHEERLLQGLVSRTPPESEKGEPGHIEQLFERKKRFRPKDHLPDKMLIGQVLVDVEKHGWVTVPEEWSNLIPWLQELGRRGDYRIRDLHGRNEGISNEQWEALLAPPRPQVRRVLNGLVEEGKLQTTLWYREVGRPAQAFILPGKATFSDRRCGQCAFFSSARRRCRLWWLINKRAPFFDKRWKQPGSLVTEFETHKMKYASRIGPHSSGCLRFLDKKRDHLRKVIPAVCDVCSGPIHQTDGVSVTCKRCGTRYVRFRGKVKVMTAYEHEYSRLYQEITGGDAKADLEAWRRKMREDQRTAYPRMPDAEDFADALAEEALELEPEPPRVWPQFSEALQVRVDDLAATTDIIRQFSIAMAQSAVNATRNVVAFSKLNSGDVSPLLALQEQYLALIHNVNQTRLLPYEALIVKQYWACYGLALIGAQQWFGPRKRSRLVKEFVDNPAGRARGYSPVDAAINYLHQRRLRQAERINVEVGFPGTCDGFLHKERYNSRKIGLLLDMIDPFKFADREELLLVVLDQGLTWRDFRVEMDRRGSNLYYPVDSGRSKLDQIGAAADRLTVRYQDRDMQLREAYRRFAESVLRTVTGNEVELLESGAPFVFLTEPSQPSGIKDSA